MSSDQTNAKHHFIQRWFLEYFAEHGKVAVWKRDDGSIRESLPINIASVKGLYTLIHDGKKDDSIEKDVTKVENSAEQIIRNINSRLPYSPTGNDKFLLARYIALQYLRTPESIRRSELHFDWAVRMQTLADINNDESMTEQEKATQRDHMLNLSWGEYTQGQGSGLARNLLAWKTLTECLEARSWHIEAFSKPSLIISDSPLGFCASFGKLPVGNTGFKDAYGIWFPLSSTRLLIMENIPVVKFFDSLGVRWNFPNLDKVWNEIQIRKTYIEAYGPISIMEQFRGKKLKEKPLSNIQGGGKVLDSFSGYYNEPPKKKYPFRQKNLEPIIEEGGS